MTEHEIKPMTWEEFYQESQRRGLDVRELAHTGSGVYQALDPTKAPARVARGEWRDTVEGPEGWFEPLAQSRCE